MRDPRKQGKRELYGLLLLLGMVAAAVAIFFADRVARLGEDTWNLVAVFPDVSRLRRGSEVWVAGHAVGRVVSVGFLPASVDTTRRIAVLLELPEELRALLNRNTTVALRTPRLFDDQVIDLMPGAGTALPLQERDTVYGAAQVRLVEVMQRAMRLRGAADSLGRDAKAIELLRERSGASVAMQRMVDNLTLVQQEFTALSQGADAGSLALILNDTESRGALARLGNAIGQITTSLEARLRPDSNRPPMPEYRELSRHATELGERLAQLQLLAATPNGSGGRFLQDSALIMAVHRTQAQLDSLIAEAKKNPLRYVF